jgi:hypothetical protein
MEAHLNKLKAEGEELYQTLFSAEDINPLIDALTKVVGLIENIAEGLGGGRGIIGLLASSGLALFGDKIAEGMARAWRNTKGFIEDL